MVSVHNGTRPPTLPVPSVVSARLVPRWSGPDRNCDQLHPQLTTVTVTVGLVLAR